MGVDQSMLLVSLQEIHLHLMTEGKIAFNFVFSVIRDGTSNQCEVPRDPRFPECPGKVDVSVSIRWFNLTSCISNSWNCSGNFHLLLQESLSYWCETLHVVIQKDSSETSYAKFTVITAKTLM